MSFEIQLKFTQQILEGMHISSCIVTNPKEYIPSSIDNGLRFMLFGSQNYAEILVNSMYQAKENTIYRFFDEYYCNYIFLKMPTSKGFLFVGPYVCSPISDSLVKNKSEYLKLDEIQSEKLLKYYQNLPVIEDENSLFVIINTLGINLWGSSENFNTEYVDYMIPDNIEPICVSSEILYSKESPASLSVLELNYENEKRLMDAVSRGELHKLNSISSAVYNNGMEQRTSDSLRNRKNYLIIFNTLLRKAAENGGVHPLHIDRISSLFARKIEEVHSVDRSMTLQSEMIRDYCLLVKKHSLTEYSYLVGKTITLISYDLTADLSLKNIAKQLNVNPTYLSALFRKEVGCTLTDYVNKRRIERAVGLLNETDKQVNNIAFECGIQDTNYFIKLFKRFTGITPNKYRVRFVKQTESRNE